VFERQALQPSRPPFHAFCPFGQDQLGAERFQYFSSLDAHCLRHGEDKPVTFCGRHKGQCNTGVPAGRSMITESLVSKPFFSASSIIARPMRSFYAPIAGLKKLQFRGNFAPFHRIQFDLIPLTSGVYCQFNWCNYFLQSSSDASLC